MTGTFSNLSAGAGMQHSGFDYSADSLTQSSSNNTDISSVIETVGGKRKHCRLTSKSTKNNLNQSSSNHEVRVYDQHLLQTGGDQRLVGLTMKTGKRLGPLDHFGPFLGNLNQNGRVKTSWNGSFVSKKIDKRTVTMQVFRHRMSQTEKIAVGTTPADPTGNTSQGPYPGSLDDASSIPIGVPKVLFPQNSSVPINHKYMEDVTLPDSGGVVTNAFSQHAPGDVAFCAINRPDLEDMSWNLNKLKLFPLQYGLTTPPVSAKEVKPFELNMHRRQSVLQQNNFQKVLATNLGAEAPASSASLSPYVYKVVLRYGVITYELMNKNDTGCQVEFIVYKFKKTANMSADPAVYASSTKSHGSADVSAYYPLNKLMDACGQGYLSTVGDDYATENLAGRHPEERDVYDNPNFPLFPTLKKTIASTQPFTEVMRNKFAMPSGSRRTMTINLPGEVYNPCSIRQTDVEKPYPSTKDDDGNITLASQLVATTNWGDQLRSHMIPILDEYSYAVVLSVNGQKMTRFFDKTATSGTYCTRAVGNIAPDAYLPPYNNLPIITYIGYYPVNMAYPPDLLAGAWDASTTPGTGPCMFHCFSLADNPFLVHSPSGEENYVMILPNGILPTDENTCLMRFVCITGNVPSDISGYPGVPCDCYMLKNSLQFYDVQQGSYYGPKKGCDFIKTATPYICCPPDQGISHYVVHNVSSTNFTYESSSTMPRITSLCNTTATPAVQSINMNIVLFTNDTVDIPGNNGSSFPMGDNYGGHHVDYCASYTEHIGACMYSTPTERNLYDCGQPNKPTAPTGAGVSKEHSRMILPSSQAVRSGAITTKVLGPGATDVSYSQTSGSYTVGSEQ